MHPYKPGQRHQMEWIIALINQSISINLTPVQLYTVSIDLHLCTYSSLGPYMVQPTVALPALSCRLVMLMLPPNPPSFHIVRQMNMFSCCFVTLPGSSWPERGVNGQTSGIALPTDGSTAC